MRFCVMGSPICTAVAGEPSCSSSDENVAPWMPSLPMLPADHDDVVARQGLLLVALARR